jgi:hypothetical protein
MLEHFWFACGCCFLLTHELDAVRAHEWRLLPLLRSLPDEQAYQLFTALHVPLYLLLIVGLFGSAGVNEALLVGLNAFFVVHALLHWLLHRHPLYTFRSALSWVLILGAAAAGTIDLILRLGLS